MTADPYRFGCPTRPALPTRVSQAHGQEPSVGALQDDPRVEIPLSDGSSLLGSVTDRHGRMVTLYIETKLEPAEIVAFYERAYAGGGWRPQESAMPYTGIGGLGSCRRRRRARTPEAVRSAGARRSRMRTRHRDRRTILWAPLVGGHKIVRLCCGARA